MKNKNKEVVMKKEIKKIRKRFTEEFYKNNKGALGMSVLTMALLSGCNLLISYLLQQITDIAMGKELGPLFLLCRYSVAAFIAFIIIYSIQRVSFSRFMRRALTQYKAYAFREITKKSIHAFNGENTGKYISALTNDVSSIESNYLGDVFNLIIKSVAFVGALAMMIYYSPLLTLVALLLSLFPIVASILCGNRLTVAEKEVSKENDNFVSSVKDLLSGFAVIKSFKAEEEICKLYENNNKRLEEKKYVRRMTKELVSMIGSAAGMIAQIGVFLFGAYLAIVGDTVTPGVVIVFLQLMNFVVEPIGTVPPILANRKAAAALIDKLAEAVNENIRTEGKMVDHKLDQCIQLNHVNYSYEKEKPVLKDVSCRFEAGKSYAIVGGSGSGKSTLLNLLMGSDDGYEGNIYMDGDELRTIHTDSLYELVSIIQQNVFVFNSSIEDNITMFKKFSEEKIQNAIQMSGLSRLIEEKGNDYLCGENGSGLSGGERQRISIARSLLRETPILLVDEATAALDAETAYSVTSAILGISGLTRIIVTHRLEESLLKKYDGILVMKQGVICEQGSFEELIEKKDYFYSLYTVAKSE